MIGIAYDMSALSLVQQMVIDERTMATLPCSFGCCSIVDVPFYLIEKKRRFIKLSSDKNREANPFDLFYKIQLTKCEQ